MTRRRSLRRGWRDSPSGSAPHRATRWRGYPRCGRPHAHRFDGVRRRQRRRSAAGPHRPVTHTARPRGGVRTVTIPRATRADLVDHIQRYGDPEPTGPLFTGEKSGNPVRGPNLSQRSRRGRDVADIGLAGVRFHELRHAGNIWASKAGMSTKDLMARMGHDDMRAALIYQRATSDADARIADSLSKLVDEHRGRGHGRARPT